jgi:hypothetical protein
MVLLVFSEEELGKDGRGTKKEGVQTWAAGNAPWALRYTGLMSESRGGGAVKAQYDKRQTERYNLPNQGPGSRITYE